MWGVWPKCGLFSSFSSFSLGPWGWLASGGSFVILKGDGEMAPAPFVCRRCRHTTTHSGGALFRHFLLRVLLRAFGCQVMDAMVGHSPCPLIIVARPVGGDGSIPSRWFFLRPPEIWKGMAGGGTGGGRAGGLSPLGPRFPFRVAASGLKRGPSRFLPALLFCEIPSAGQMWHRLS